VCNADIARRLAILLAPEAGLPGLSTEVQLQRYDPEFVLEQYEKLAEMCIVQRAAQQADVVLEAAEVAGLQPSPAMLTKLTAALRGQPRRSEVSLGWWRVGRAEGTTHVQLRCAGQPSQAMLTMLTAALGGQPRHTEVGLGWWHGGWRWCQGADFGHVRSTAGTPHMEADWQPCGASLGAARGAWGGGTWGCAVCRLGQLAGPLQLKLQGCCQVGQHGL
jgi:hypothetical protein